MTPLFHEISSLGTEENNNRTANIDTATTREILELINEQDALVAPAVHAELASQP